jgi:dipeptidyl aminopeptidase/acylaminoacyl peptidase
LDPNHLGALGASAGGHLVAMLGVTDTLVKSPGELADFSSRATCVVDLFGPTDLTADFSNNYSGGIPVPEIISRFIGHKKDEAPALYQEASPLFNIDNKTVPFLIIHGNKDPSVPFSQSQHFYDALRAQGIRASLLGFKDAGHGLTTEEDKKKAIEAIQLFFKTYL